MKQISLLKQRDGFYWSSQDAKHVDMREKFLAKMLAFVHIWVELVSYPLPTHRTSFGFKVNILLFPQWQNKFLMTSRTWISDIDISTHFFPPLPEK